MQAREVHHPEDGDTPGIPPENTLAIDGELFCGAFQSVLEIGSQSRIGQIKCVRMLPVVSGDAMQSIPDDFVVHFDGSSRRPSKLPGAKLIEPTMAATASARSILPCSLRCFSLWISIPTRP